MDAQFEEIAEQLTKRAEKIGLYARDCVIIGSGDEVDRDKINSPEIKDMLASGEVKLALLATFTIGDLAFSDRIQNPEKFDTDKQFAQMMPTEAEMTIDSVRDKLGSITAETSAADILAMFDEPTEDE